ncbi:organic hydroperoxide resistance protein [Staphylococcus massiliensis]|uniref:Organic hydroperoxide resistance protein n=1 Tax=Staphylococcus massiliensis S46 TaxID=1229783 RepID=K9ALE7_9STAP|nr:organic hydroperoxide resistance protein [Staphylococcus massiliensis]EKU48198.1 Organic hydroperoxide resistance protein [Staphylococcus massiliensis S46]MCG3399542.1 organic hydroperoxide resistance protein [Staphylococcus massiliensis]MCG3402051.1 organic hydroperoxide resistance protein [Staphylococcus massiliensis]MCG3412698.1 organic hydroperoxide resistance protein [Staphylococcus massiliensis]POA01010.1 organic hydroperoxide resistance protein [Staphylococcus massiliensis CCUG 55927
MAVKYETTATNTGGRKGHVSTDDKVLDLEVLPPSDDNNSKTNPEQLFAAGYASCFNGAFDLILKQNKVTDAEPKVSITVRLVDDEEAESPKLDVSIEATVKNMEQEDAEKYLKMAHEFCPYSKAIKGNVDVDLNVKAE